MATLFSELKRRNVFRVGVAYVVASWLVIEVASVLLDIYTAPGWVLRVLVGLLVLGLPLALGFSWAFELTLGRSDLPRPRPETDRNLH